MLKWVLLQPQMSRRELRCPLCLTYCWEYTLNPRGSECLPLSSCKYIFQDWGVWKEKAVPYRHFSLMLHRSCHIWRITVYRCPWSRQLPTCKQQTLCTHASCRASLCILANGKTYGTWILLWMCRGYCVCLYFPLFLPIRCKEQSSL